MKLRIFSNLVLSSAIIQVLFNNLCMFQSDHQNSEKRGNQTGKHTRTVHYDSTKHEKRAG